MKQLLLLSNSTNYGQGFLAHALPRIWQLVAGKTVTFVPFADTEWVEYTDMVRQTLAAVGLEVVGVTDAETAAEKIQAAEVLFVGGGNTFLLLKTLQELQLLELIKTKVEQGVPYIGSSAGTNLACPTVMTTNDMPIVQPADFKALGLVDFQINCHYFEPAPDSQHMGETRPQRLTEFATIAQQPVIGLYEGSWLEMSDGECQLAGEGDAVVFKPGSEKKVLKKGRLEI